MKHTRTHAHGRRPGAAWAAWLAAWLAAAGYAGPAAAQASYEDIGRAVDDLALRLVDRGRGLLRERRVLVRPHDFFEQGTQRRLPLSEALSEGFRVKLSEHGVRVVSELGNDDAVMDLKGKWRLLSGAQGVHLSVRVIEQTGSGERRQIAAAEGRLEQIAPNLIEPDLEFMGRDVVRQLESPLGGKRTVYVRPPAVSGGDAPQPDRLSAELVDWLKTALADAGHKLTVVEPRSLDSLSARTLETRGARGLGPARPAPGSPAPSFLGDALQVESELDGRASVHDENVKVRLRVLDNRTREVLVGATADLAKSWLPPGLWRPVQHCYEPTLPENPGFGLKLATTHGERRVTYRDGERIRFLVQVERPSHLYLFVVDSTCRIMVLYPGFDDIANRLSAGRAVVPRDNDEQVVEVKPPYGQDIVLALATAEPVDPPRDWLDGHATAADLQRWLRRLSARGAGDMAEAQVTLITEP